MSRLRAQYFKVRRTWTGRPDLLQKMRRILADPSLERVSAQRIADFLREPVEQVWTGLEYLADQEELVTAPADMQGKKRKALYAMPWRVAVEKRYRLDGEAEPIAMPDSEEKREARCPKCGQPIKRRHQRGEFHDPEKCMWHNIRDIMKL